MKSNLHKNVKKAILLGLAVSTLGYGIGVEAATAVTPVGGGSYTLSGDQYVSATTTNNITFSVTGTMNASGAGINIVDVRGTGTEPFNSGITANVSNLTGTVNSAGSASDVRAVYAINNSIVNLSGNNSFTVLGGDGMTASSGGTINITGGTTTINSTTTTAGAWRHGIENQANINVYTGATLTLSYQRTSALVANEGV